MSYEPRGIRFTDKHQGDMLLVTEGPYAGWLCRRHPDGQWVTVRIATDEDRTRLAEIERRVA